MVHRLFRQIFRFLYPILYSRREFKLFLKASTEHIRTRTLALASATDYFANFIRPIPITAPFGNSLLVLAPHQDDEAIGCGGVLAQQVRSGGEAFVMMLTDGTEGFVPHDGITTAQFSRMRNDESRACAAVIGLPEPAFMDYLTLEGAFTQAVEAIRNQIVQRSVDVILTPWVLDGHPDHRTTNYMLATVLKDINRPIRVLQYEVWGMCIPNVIVAIDDVIDAKIEMLKCFRIANAALDYTNSTVGLNMFHSRMLPAGHCRYAERFFELPRTEFIELVENVRKSE